MTKKVKILHLLQSRRFSGAENVACQIIDIFQNDNIEMVYCSRDGQIRDTLNERNIKFYPIEKLNVKEVKKVIREYRPDIIHAHDVAASVVATLAGGKAKIISHMHVNHENMKKVNLKTLLYLKCAKRFKHIFWVSNSSFDKYVFKNYLSQKSSVLYNIIDQKSIQESVNSDFENYDFDVVYIGRLTYQKNPERLIKVLKCAIDMKNDIKIAIIGTGDMLEETKKLSKELYLEDNISFLGFKSNPLKLLNDAKALIMTSRFEGTPMCALEAMALGVPIVSTPTDGLIDLIEDGKTGYLSNDDNKLAWSLVQLIENKTLRNRFSTSILEKSNEINDVSKYKDSISSAYNEICKEIFITTERK